MKIKKLKSGDYIKKEQIQSLLNKGKNYIIESNTNTGKTEACIKGAIDSGKNFIFAVDCKLLADQLGKQYSLPVYYAGKTLVKSNCITLYNHVNQFKDPNTILFVDEFHSLIKDYGYKKNVIDNLIESFSSYKQIIGLTGTLIEPMQGFNIMKFEKNREERTINQIGFVHDYTQALLYSIVNNRNKTHYISIFDKSNEAVNIKANLLNIGYKESEIAFINSETKNSKAFKELIDFKKVKNSKIIITTYTQGFNIEGNDYMLHIIPKTNAWHSVADIEQVVNRFRNEVPKIHLYWNHELNYKTKFDYNLEKKKEREVGLNLINNFGAQCNWTNTDNLNPFQCNLIKNHLETNSILNVDFKLKLNNLGIFHNVYSKATTESYKDRKFLAEQLKKHNYCLKQDLNNYTHSIDKSKVEAIKKSIIEFKTEKLRERLSNIHNNKFSVNKQDELSIRYHKLTDYYEPNKAFEILNDILLDKKKWNVELIKLNTKYSRSLIDNQLKEKIYSVFTEEKYSKTQIFDKMNEVHEALRLDKITSKTKATQLFKNYFESKRCRMGNDSSAILILNKIAA